MSIKLIKNLVKIANILDVNEFHNESDTITKIASNLVYKMAQNEEFDATDYSMELDLGDFPLPSTADFFQFENNPIFQRYKMMLQDDPNFIDETGEMKRNLISLAKQLFEKDVDVNDGMQGTALKGFEEDFVDYLIEKSFITSSPDFMVSEEVAFDLLDVVKEDFTRPEYDELGRRIV